MPVKHLSITNTNLSEGVTAIDGIVPRLLHASPPDEVGAPSCPVLLSIVAKNRSPSMSENSQRYPPADAPPAPPPEPPLDPLDEPPQLARPSIGKDIRASIAYFCHVFFLTLSPRMLGSRPLVSHKLLAMKIIDGCLICNARGIVSRLKAAPV